jgi:hypothetical protein
MFDEDFAVRAYLTLHDQDWQAMLNPLLGSFPSFSPDSNMRAEKRPRAVRFSIEQSDHLLLLFGLSVAPPTHKKQYRGEQSTLLEFS